MRTCRQVSEELKSRVDIVQTVGHYVRLRKAGSRYVGLCPFHEGGRSSSLCINPSAGDFICSSCGSTGDSFEFVRQLLKVSVHDAVKVLAARNGVDLPDGLC